ncbi:glycosyltransferase family 2 protein [Polynucleobacter rarus]|uniref:glycosyltransferase family 2 protein n=1 Tax=Polynucleobacter rarus TaxID=556055 RepID=UPI000D3E1921|nr:glycosyltransferase family 2 protein [Polynucleobacter rarus]
MNMSNSCVAILLATYNGQKFLIEQLESIALQTHNNWYLIVSDDGSVDGTLDILYKYQKKWSPGKLLIRKGPSRGFCSNFLSMAVDCSIVSDFYAFCDQDDVWLPEKLAIALSNIKRRQRDGIPYLYCGRTTYVDEGLKKIGISPLFVFPRTFRNALVQSIAGGNTMVFNRDAKSILERVGMVEHSSHDWWIYQLVTGCGGEVFYDQDPQVLYRQHAHSLVGANVSIFSKFKRMKFILNGRFKGWSDLSINALDKATPLLTSANVEILNILKKMRAGSLKDRMRLMEVAGLYRQTWKGTISLIIAAIINRI